MSAQFQQGNANERKSGQSLFSNRPRTNLPRLVEDVPEGNRAAISQALRDLSFAESEFAVQPALISGLIPRKKQRIEGVVVSSKMDKTIVVVNERRVNHPLYKRVIRITKKFYAHDEYNSAKEGDKVGLVETRPISKTKRWRLEAILQRKEKVHKIPEWLRVPPLVTLSIQGKTSKLEIGRAYDVLVHVQDKQYKLFDQKTQIVESDTALETPPPARIDPDPPYKRDIELFLRISGDTLRPQPPVLFIRAAATGPIVHPSQFTINARQPGTHKLFLSVFRRDNNELIQSQLFEFEVA